MHTHSFTNCPTAHSTSEHETMQVHRVARCLLFIHSLICQILLVVLPSSGSMVGTGGMGTRRTQPYPRGARYPVGTMVGKHKEARNMDPEPTEDALSTVIQEYEKCFWGK